VCSVPLSLAGAVTHGRLTVRVPPSCHMLVRFAPLHCAPTPMPRPSPRWALGLVTLRRPNAVRGTPRPSRALKGSVSSMFEGERIPADSASRMNQFSLLGNFLGLWCI